MLQQFLNRIHQMERKFSRSFGTDISTPVRRAESWLHFHLADHGLLRTVWTNLFQIAPGVWRSNQPTPRRLKRYHDMGIRTVLNLRGEDKFSFYLLEREACAALGLKLIDIKIYARSLVRKERFLELLALFETLEKPFVLHCKSGADRAGLASALWLMHMEGQPVEVARRQLGLKYVHLKHTRTGILDYMLDVYEADNRAEPMPIRRWFEEKYDPKAIDAAYKRKTGRLRDV